MQARTNTAPYAVQEWTATLSTVSIIIKLGWINHYTLGLFVQPSGWQLNSKTWAQGWGRFFFNTSLVQGSFLLSTLHAIATLPLSASSEPTEILFVLIELTFSASSIKYSLDSASGCVSRSWAASVLPISNLSLFSGSGLLKGNANCFSPLTEGGSCCSLSCSEEHSRAQPCSH